MESNLDPFGKNSRAFTSWLTGNAGVVISPKIAVADLRNSGAGRGVVALSQIAEGDTLFSIPRKSILCVDNSALSTLIPQKFSKLETWLALVTVMIYETKDCSFWKPYIDVLPTTFNTLIYWTPEELKELQGSAVLEKIGKEDAEIQFREKLLPIVQEYPELFSGTILDTSGNRLEESLIEASHRMASCIMSYSFDVEASGDRSRRCSEKERNNEEDKEEEDIDEDSEDESECGAYFKGMVPLADMLNADAERNNARLFYSRETLEMKSIRDIAAGEELFNDYGPLPRSDLLRRYGYITPNYAQYDVVEIPTKLLIDCISSQLSEEEVLERTDYLLDEGVLEDGYDIGADFQIQDEILTVIHIIALSTNEFKSYKKKNKLPKPKRTSLAKSTLIDVVTKRLAIYPSNVSEDKTILSTIEQEKRQQGDYHNMRVEMALRVRLGEKEILQKTLEDVCSWEVGGGKNINLD